jgi:transmembrane sensor
MSGDQRVELRGLKLAWNEGRTEWLLSQVEARLERRKLGLRMALASAALVSAFCLVFFALRSNQATSAVRLREGSEIRLDRALSEVRVAEESASRVLVELVRGAARYSVVPNPARIFEVHAGAVTVRVVGTEFLVERRAEKTWVEVTRGKVRVSWGDTQALLAAGESGLFPRAASAPNLASASNDSGASAAPRPADSAVVEPSASGALENTPAARAREATQAYRSHVARKDYRGAYVVLSKNPTLAGDTVKELLVAADVARLSDHPAEAVPYLQRIIRDHARDERAPMAAFTLGRTLSGLGRTREAMSMFARVRSAWPRSPLGEDALLRQAEAASQLGDLAGAARIAEQYERDYPNGRRRAEVRRYARLE